MKIVPHGKILRPKRSCKLNELLCKFNNLSLNTFKVSYDNRGIRMLWEGLNCSTCIWYTRM